MTVPGKSGLLVIVALIVAALIGALTISNRSNDHLEQVHAGIQSDFPTVKHISAADLSRLAGEDVVLFDVREADEFDVSHIEGAALLLPDEPVEEFLAEYGASVAGKTIIFYCSVGVRSSQYADQAQSQLQDLGAVQVVNLQHGLFGWHNEGRPLVSYDGGSTDLIHPYDQYWGRLVNRQALISTEQD